MEQNPDIAALTRKYLDGSMTIEEWALLREHLEAGSSIMEDALLEAVSTESYPAVFDAADIKQKYGKLQKEMHKGRILKMRRWWQVAAAVLILGAIAWWALPGRDSLPQASVHIEPGRSGAVLTLSDGTEILLDSAGNGVIASQQSVQLVLSNGVLAYQSTGTFKGSAAYNKMTTPKGRQFQLTLPDGTKVWLNAASSIRYPTAFTGKEREVEISGEVYFEIAQRSTQPFRVKAGDKATVEVLGTRFNINAYPDEPQLQVTLLDGAVRLRSRTESMILQPGQQAALSDGRMRLLSGVNVNQVIAWTIGVFNFEGATLEEVMRQLERWYNITVVYEGKIPYIEFVGELSRNLPLHDVLEILQRMKISFRLEDGKRLVVKEEK